MSYHTQLGRIVLLRHPPILTMALLWMTKMVQREAVAFPGPQDWEVQGKHERWTASCSTLSLHQSSTKEQAGTGWCVKDSWGDKKCGMLKVEYDGVLPPSCSTFTLQRSSGLTSHICMLFTASCPNLSSCSSCSVTSRSTTITCTQLLACFCAHSFCLLGHTHPSLPVRICSHLLRSLL